MAITAHVTNGKLDKTNTTPTQNRKKSSTKASGSNLGYDDFLKLLSAEMQYQDPLEPTSNTDYVAQMATFSQLEATLSMKESLTTSSDNTIKSMANQLVGQEVVVKDDESKTGYADGIVDYVMYDDGEILISVYEEDGHIKIDVADNGLGMTEEKLEYIMHKQVVSSKRGSGIGVRNVNERIQLIYGKQYGITISSEIDEGTTATIIIPKMEETDETE